MNGATLSNCDERFQESEPTLGHQWICFGATPASRFTPRLFRNVVYSPHLELRLERTVLIKASK